MKREWGGLGIGIGLALVLAGLAVVLVTDGLAEPGWPDGRRFSGDTPGSRLHAESVRQPEVELAMASDRVGADGQPVMMTCAECHADRKPNAFARSVSQKGFHQTLRYDHGAQSCLTCHNRDDYDTLRRADGRTLPLAGSLQLCSQCHVFQHHDFVDGIHGGMSGHWDLTSGPRERATCIDCHDPHDPRRQPIQAEPPPPVVRGERSNPEGQP